MKLSLLSFFSASWVVSLFAQEFRGDFDLEFLVSSKIEYFEEFINPYVKDFSEDEQDNLLVRYRYLRELKDNPELLWSGFGKNDFNEDVWYLNRFLALSLEDSQEVNKGVDSCGEMNFDTVCPPIFWNYPLLIEMDGSVATRMVSSYMLCVSKSGKFDDRLILVSGQLIPLVDVENMNKGDLVRLVYWVLSAINRFPLGSESSGDGRIDSLDYLPFINNLWFQRREAFYPFVFCLDKRGDKPFLEENIYGFDMRLLSSICADGGAEMFRSIVEEFDLFAEHAEDIKSGNLKAIFSLGDSVVSD